MEYQVYLVSYITDSGSSGRMFYYKSDSKRVSSEEVKEMEDWLSKSNHCKTLVLNISRLADTNCRPENSHFIF